MKGSKKALINPEVGSSYYFGVFMLTESEAKIASELIGA